MLWRCVTISTEILKCYTHCTYSEIIIFGEYFSWQIKLDVIHMASPRFLNFCLGILFQVIFAFIVWYFGNREYCFYFFEMFCNALCTSPVNLRVFFVAYWCSGKGFAFLYGSSAAMVTTRRGMYALVVDNSWWNANYLSPEGPIPLNWFLQIRIEQTLVHFSIYFLYLLLSVCKMLHRFYAFSSDYLQYSFCQIPWGFYLDIHSEFTFFFIEINITGIVGGVLRQNHSLFSEDVCFGSRFCKFLQKSGRLPQWNFHDCFELGCSGKNWAELFRIKCSWIKAPRNWADAPDSLFFSFPGMLSWMVYDVECCGRWGQSSDMLIC